MQKATTSSDGTNVQTFDVEECDIPHAKDSLKRPQFVTPKELENSLTPLRESGNIDSIISLVLNAYNSLAEAVDANFANCATIAEIVDENAQAAQSANDQLNDDIVEQAKKHQHYVELNENDKQEIKLKTDIRYYKSQMIIYVKNDNMFKTISDTDAAVTAEKIIKDQGLSLRRAYITKAIILSGMKKHSHLRTTSIKSSGYAMNYSLTNPSAKSFLVMIQSKSLSTKIIQTIRTKSLEKSMSETFLTWIN